MTHTLSEKQIKYIKIALLILYTIVMIISLTHPALAKETNDITGGAPGGNNTGKGTPQNTVQGVYSSAVISIMNQIVFPAVAFILAFSLIVAIVRAVMAYNDGQSFSVIPILIIGILILVLFVIRFGLVTTNGGGQWWYDHIVTPNSTPVPTS